MNRQHTVCIHLWEVWRANGPPKESSDSLAAARAALPPVLRRANSDLGEAKPPQTPLFSRINRDRVYFIRLHHHTPNHAGIIVCTFDIDFVALAQRINTALAAQPDVNGQLIRIDPHVVLDRAVELFG